MAVKYTTSCGIVSFNEFCTHQGSCRYYESLRMFKNYFDLPSQPFGIEVMCPHHKVNKARLRGSHKTSCKWYEIPFGSTKCHLLVP